MQLDLLKAAKLKKLSLLLYMLLSFVTYSQSYAKLNHLRPLGFDGYIFNSTIGIEGGYITEEGDFEVSRVRANIGFSYFTPRKDVFLGYTMISENCCDDLVDAELQKYNYVARLHLGLGIDLITFNNVTFNPYIGPGLEIGFEFSKREFDSSFSGSTIEDVIPYVGGNLRVGIDYSINYRLGLFIEYSPSLFMDFDYEFFTMNQFGIGLRF